MNSTQTAENLVRLIGAEVELIERISALELKLKAHIVERSWKGLEQTIRKIQPTAQKIAQIEEERDSAFHTLRNEVGAPEDAGLYQVVVLLPVDMRERLAESYRRLKLSVISMQGITGSIDMYLSTVRETMQQILNEIYPYRKGKIYSRRGKAKPVHSNPMVISRRL